MNSIRKIVPKPRSRFLEVECKKCKETHVVFSKSSSKIVCNCGEELAVPTGGQAMIRGKIKNVLA